MCTVHLGQHWPTPPPSEPAHGLAAHSLEQGSSHGARSLWRQPIPAAARNEVGGGGG
jgi:hypothetical protein